MKSSIIDMNRYILHIVFLLTLGFSGCIKDKGPCFTGAGDIVSESRPVSSVRLVEVRGNVNLVLTHDTTDHSLRVEAGKNLISSLKTEVTGDKLIITNDNQCNWLRDFDLPFTVYLSLAKLDTLIYRSSGDVSCTNVIANDSIQVDIWEGSGTVRMDVRVEKSRFYIHEGTADLYVTGRSQVTFMSSRASGRADLTGLHTQLLYMYSGSPNHCYVRAVKLLAVTIDNIGDVYYLGNPEIRSVMNSSGKLIRME